MATDSIDAPFTAAERQALRRLLAKPGGGDITRNPMAVALVVAFLALIGWIALETQANREAIHENGIAIAVLQTDVATLKADVAAVKADIAAVKADIATVKVDMAELHRKIDLLLAQRSR